MDKYEIDKYGLDKMVSTHFKKKSVFHKKKKITPSPGTPTSPTGAPPPSTNLLLNYYFFKRIKKIVFA